MTGGPPAFTPEEFAAVRGMIREGMTRGEVARRFGVSQQTVGTWLQGKVRLARLAITNEKE